MSDFSVVLCGKCNSLHVDSGFDTPSTLRCSDCSNEEQFKVGKVAIPSGASLNLDELITQVKKEARI